MRRCEKPLLLFASPHSGGFTARLTAQVLHELSISSDSVDAIRLYETRVKPCIDCKVCRRSPCPFNTDDMGDILRKISTADLLICATPVYFNSVPAPFKSVIDRSQQLYTRKILLHDPVFSERKKGILLTTAGSSDPVVTRGMYALFQQFFQCAGADFIGHIAVTDTDKTPDFTVNAALIEDVRKKL